MIEPFKYLSIIWGCKMGKLPSIKREKALKIFFTAVGHFGKEVHLKDGLRYCVDLAHIQRAFATTNPYPYLREIELRLLEMGLEFVRYREMGKVYYCYKTKKGVKVNEEAD